MSRQEDQQAFIALVEMFLAGDVTPLDFHDEVIPRFITYVNDGSYSSPKQTHKSKQVDAIYYAWFDCEMSNSEFAAKWRELGGDPYEEFFDQLICIVHSFCMCYDLGYDPPDHNDIDETQLRIEVSETFQTFKMRCTQGS